MIYEFIAKNNELTEENVGQLLKIKHNRQCLNVFLEDEIIETFDLPKELEYSFNIVPEKRVLVDRKGEDYILRLVRFADIHRHSMYSLSRSTNRIEDLVEKTEVYSGITDYGNMLGSLDFYKKMVEANKKPIIGFEAYLETLDDKKDNNTIVLIAKTKKGYNNISELVYRGSKNKSSDEYDRPYITYDDLEELKEDVIAISPYDTSEIGTFLYKNFYTRASEVAETLQDIFKEDYYLEIRRHTNEDKDKYVTNSIFRMSRELGLKLIAGTGSYYKNKDDKFAHEVLLGMKEEAKLSENRTKLAGENYHLLSVEEVEKLFSDIPDAISNTYEIIEKINFEFELGNITMPHFVIPEEFEDEKTYLEHLCAEGFKSRFLTTEKYDNPEYKERLDYELDIITSMGFEGYFLIVWDFIKYAKDNGIAVGPGRGSAAGSLVSYVLNIVNLDPIEHGLLFERFLNPERISMPDIDVDIQDSRRQEVIEYITEKYGEEAVAGIITLGTFAAKTSIRDVAKFFELSQEEIDSLREAIPEDPKMTLDMAYETSPDFKKLIDKNINNKKIFEVAKKIEGLPRHFSQHACGYIVTTGRVLDYVPMIDLEGTQVAAFTMSELEELGLLKIDLLGLGTMTILSNAMEAINKKYGTNYNDSNIDLYNPYVYKYLSTGNTTGLFQIESVGMTDLIKTSFEDVSSRIKEIEDRYEARGYFEINIRDVDNIEKYSKEMKELGFELFSRLIADIALYRPGPREFIPQYLEGLKNSSQIHYDTPELEPILKETYGVIVYQEQVQQIARTLAGYSLGRGDILRRAMGKKKMDVMEKEKDIFLNGLEGEVVGAIKNGISEEAATTIWNKMLDFANYAFNKSHAGVYAYIAFYTAFLKTYYPIEFYNASLNVNLVKKDKDKINHLIYDLKDNNLELRSPSVTYSEKEFSVKENAIRFGLGSIKNLGEKVTPIITERKLNGPYKDLKDFLNRLSQELTVSKLVPLIYAGALDEFGGTRKEKLDNLDNIKKYLDDIKKITKVDNELGRKNLDDFYLDYVDFEYETIEEELDETELLFKEKEYTETFITKHPVDNYKTKISTLETTDISELITEEETDTNEKYIGKTVKVVGILSLRKIYTKKDNKLMYAGSIEDQTGRISVVLFNKNIKDDWIDLDKTTEKKVFLLEGKYQVNDYGPQILIDNIINIEDIEASSETAILVTIKDVKELQKLKEIADIESGNVDLWVKCNEQIIKYKDPIAFNMTQELKIIEEFGEIERSFN